MRRDVMILIIAVIAMIVLGFIIQFCGMMIDHQCYQLEPNEFYQSTICEKYWKNEQTGDGLDGIMDKKSR